MSALEGRKGTIQMMNPKDLAYESETGCLIWLLALEQVVESVQPQRGGAWLWHQARWGPIPAPAFASSGIL